MAGIYFKRIFHPVGQGAFFTEQLIDMKSSQTLFNVVYDCGSFTNVNRRYPLEAPQLLRNEIDKVFNKECHIDLLFISHFDGDHANGLDYLLSNSTMDNRTLAVIPFKYPLLILVMEEDYPELAHFIYNAVTNNNVHFVGINGNSNDEYPRLDPIDREDMLKESDILGQKLIAFKPYTIKDPVWYYLPFMLSGVDQYQNEFISKAENIADLNDIQSIIAKKEELKNIYKEIGESIGKNTKINTNSLLMLSFPASPNYCVDYTRATVCDSYFDDYYKWNRGYIRYKFSEKEHIYPGSCMYTGDTSSNTKVFWTAFNSILCSYLTKENHRLALFQIPHHGSRLSNYDGIVDERRIYAAFTNFEPDYWQKIYDPNISLQFYLHQKPLILVTDDDSFRLEECWFLNI